MDEKVLEGGYIGTGTMLLCLTEDLKQNAQFINESNSEMCEKIAFVNDKCNKMTHDMQHIESTAIIASGNIKQINNKVDRIESQLTHISDKVLVTEKEISSMRTDIDNMENQISRMNKKIDINHQEVKDRMNELENNISTQLQCFLNNITSICNQNNKIKS